MGQASPFKPIALVVEDDIMQRAVAAMLLEESGMGVIQCESAEAALRVLEKMGGCCSLMFTDVNLSGRMDGVELAHLAHVRCPNLRVVVTSGRALKAGLPDGATFMSKPWLPLDLLREASGRSIDDARHGVLSVVDHSFVSAFARSFSAALAFFASAASTRASCARILSD